MFEEYLGLFAFGITTFLSPCSLALISVFLTYSVGIGKNALKGVIIGCSFAAAMCLVFFSIGFAITSLVPLTLLNSQLFLGLSGILLILFGINNLGFLKRFKLTTEASKSANERINSVRINTLTYFSKYNYAISSFLFGLVISVALGPCSLSLVLPAVLLTMLTAPTAFHGGLMLLMFGLGHALPVVLLTTLFAGTRKLASQKISKNAEWLPKIFGIVFLVIGITIVGYAIGSVFQ
jgi:cytochrome c-type biogenesis protein